MKTILVLSITLLLGGCAAESDQYHIVRLCNGYNKLYQDLNGKYWVGNVFSQAEPVLQENLADVCPVGERR